MGGKSEPVNVCLFTLLKMMIWRELRRVHPRKSAEEDYEIIAEKVNGFRDSTSNLKKRYNR